MLAFTLFAALLAVGAPVEPVNAVLGDASWIALYGEAPTASADETARIRVHLQHVADRLAAADVGHLTVDQRAKRAWAVDALRVYAAQGVFPRRADAHPGRRPRFIDDRGVHCAVGELIRRSGRPGLARRIDRRWSLAHVPDMASPALLEWARVHGLSVRELASIQPTYGPPLNTEQLPRRVDEVIARRLVPCGVERPVPAELTLHVELKPRWKLQVAEVGPPTAFGGCVVEWIRAGRRGMRGVNRLGQPEPPFGTRKGRVWPTIDSRVPVKPPLTAALFEARMAALDLRQTAAECWARDWPEVLLVEAQIGADGQGAPTLTVATVPAEPAAVACFEAIIRPRVLLERPPRAWPDVRWTWSEPAHLLPGTLARLVRAEACAHVDPCLKSSSVAADRALYTKAARAAAPKALRIPLTAALTVDPIAVTLAVEPIDGASPAFGRCLGARTADVVRADLQRLHDAPSFPPIDEPSRMRLNVDCMPGHSAAGRDPQALSPAPATSGSP